MIFSIILLLVAVFGVLGIATALWSLSEDSRARRRHKVYEEDVESAAELLTWLHQNREQPHSMAIPRKRPILRTRSYSVLLR